MSTKPLILTMEIHIQIQTLRLASYLYSKSISTIYLTLTRSTILKGLRLQLCTLNRMGLLSDITRIFRENGLSISTIDVGTNGERAVGSFFVTDASGHSVDPQRVELVIKEIGGSVALIQEASKLAAQASSSSASRPIQGIKDARVEDKPRFSLGSLLWSQLGRLSSNFGSI